MQPIAATIYLITTLLQLYATLLLLRILLQVVKADYFNQVCQIIVQLSDPVIKPLRRLLPPIRRIDTAAVLLIFVIETVVVWLRFYAASVELPITSLLVLGVLRSVQLLLMTYLVMIIANVLLTLFGQQARHPIIPLIYAMTEPVLARVRRVVPPLAGIDLSPLFACIGIMFLLILLGLR